ncbi:MAG: hypothetical protein KatS3mg077_1153 [Candidatus Binatia bacterium]|nr:MAG: hypothetical protein KatS3mg077_1153 [Candidatus Binatia bacterium]
MACGDGGGGLRPPGGCERALAGIAFEDAMVTGRTRSFPLFRSDAARAWDFSGHALGARCDALRWRYLPAAQRCPARMKFRTGAGFRSTRATTSRPVRVCRIPSGRTSGIVPLLAFEPRTASSARTEPGPVWLQERFRLYERCGMESRPTMRSFTSLRQGNSATLLVPENVPGLCACHDIEKRSRIR